MTFTGGTPAGTPPLPAGALSLPGSVVTKLGPVACRGCGGSVTWAVRWIEIPEVNLRWPAQTMLRRGWWNDDLTAHQCAA